MRRCASTLALWFATATAGAAPLFSAYKDITVGFDKERYRISLEDSAPRTLSLAFASGECGAEHWAGFDAQRLADKALPSLRESGRRYIVSTGGEAGVFTCASEAGMRAFVERYLGPGLVGFDFDIEGRQTEAQIDDLVREAAAAQQRWPQLMFSFTLATHAGSDERQQGLNATGERVMQALRRHRFDRAVVNLMVMNYGPASARLCVLRAVGDCDMGRSGLQAARNLKQRWDVPFERIALTAMLGENDVAGNVFSPADAAVLAAGARELGLAGVHYWSLDRDQPCGAGSERVSSRCHGLPDVPAGSFGRLLGGR